LRQLKEVKHAKTLQQFGYAFIWVEQFNSRRGLARTASRVLQTEAREHTQERTIHESALGQIEHKVMTPLLAQFLNYRFEIDTRREIRASADLNTGEALARENPHLSWRSAHTSKNNYNFIDAELCRRGNGRIPRYPQSAPVFAVAPVIRPNRWTQAAGCT